MNIYNKAIATILITVLYSIVFSGCSSKDIKLYEMHPAYAKKYPQYKQYLEIFNKNGVSDFDIRQSIAAAAIEGKKRGYRYFMMGSDNEAVLNGINALNNYYGSPITNVQEILDYCTQEVFGEQRPGCWDGGRKQNVSISVKYTNERPVDYLVWDIEETLNDPMIKGSPTEYELFPVEYTCKHESLKSPTEECILDEVRKEAPVFLLPATTKAN